MIQETKLSPEAVLEGIQQRPHWRVLIRPDVFNPELIASRDDCLRIVDECRVAIGARRFPIADRLRDHTLYDQHCVSIGDGGGRPEFWRFCQSGQFVYLFEFWEDAWLKDENERTALSKVRYWGNPPSDFQYNGCLDFIELMRTVTEFTEFAARLAQRAKYTGVIHLQIELHHVKNRLLTALDKFRLWHGFYYSVSDDLAIKRSYPIETLLGSTAEQAREIIHSIYQSYQWLDPDMDLVAREQQKFLTGN